MKKPKFKIRDIVKTITLVEGSPEFISEVIGIEIETFSDGIDYKYQLLNGEETYGEYLELYKY